jgi:hypothetical protein
MWKLTELIQRIVGATVASIAVELAFCPACPTTEATREIFFREDFAARLGAMIAPFAVTAALVGLVLSRLRRGARTSRGSSAAR